MGRPGRRKDLGTCPASGDIAECVDPMSHGRGLNADATPEQQVTLVPQSVVFLPLLRGRAPRPPRCILERITWGNYLKRVRQC